MNYWFLYTINDGNIYGSPYGGDTTEWTNIPEGCGVIGFVDDKVTDTAIDAFVNYQNYKVVNSQLVKLTDAEKAILWPVVEQPKTELEIVQEELETLKISAAKSSSDFMDFMELAFSTIPSLTE